MNHIAEQAIEAYVRQPQALDANTLSEVAGHLKTCGACQGIANYLRDFYAELDRRQHETFPQLEAFVKGLFPQRGVIALQPLRLPPEKGYASDEYTLVLAAMSPKPVGQRFQTVATLASEHKDVLLRVLCDHESKTFRLYVLAEDRHKGAHALISFPALGLEVLADERGQVAFTLDEKVPPDNWEHIKCVLRPPLAAVRVHAGEPGGDAPESDLCSSAFGDLTLIEAERQLAPRPANSSGNSLTIFVNEYEISLARTESTLTLVARPTGPDAQPSSLAALEGTASGLLFIPLQNGQGACALPAVTQDLSIRFYSC